MDVILSPVQIEEKESVEKLRDFLSEAYLEVCKQCHSKANDIFADALAITEKLGNDHGEPSTSNFLHNIVYIDHAHSLYLDYLIALPGEGAAEKVESEESIEEEDKVEDQSLEENKAGVQEGDEKGTEEQDEDVKDKGEQEGTNLEQAKEFFILAKQFFEEYTVKPDVPYWNARLNNCTVCQVCKYIAEIAFLQGNVEEALCTARLAATRAQEQLQDMPVFIFGLLFDCLLYMIASPARKLEKGALVTASAASAVLRELSKTGDGADDEGGFSDEDEEEEKEDYVMTLAELSKDFEECKKQIEIILRDKDGDMSDDFISGTLNNMLLAKDKRVFRKWSESQPSSQHTSEEDNEGEDSETEDAEPTSVKMVKNVQPPAAPNTANMIQHLVRRKRKDPEVAQAITTLDQDVDTLTNDDVKIESPAKKIKN